jgi:hypothetical protein
MPADDLLRFIGGPLPFSIWWLVAGVLLVLAVIGWCTGVFVWTLPPARLRSIPVVNRLHAALTRRRFIRSLRVIDERFRGGMLSPAQASAEISRTLRRFLFVKTGSRAQYMHVDEVSDGPLAPAAPLLAWLNDVQFSPQSRADVIELNHAAEELISTWS